MGIKMVLAISNSIQKRVKSKHSFEDIKEILVDEIYDAYNDSGKFNTKLN